MLVLFVAALLAGRSHSQPNVEVVETAISESPYSTITIPSLVVSGSNPCIAVCFSEHSPAVAQSVTWNGGAESLTEVIAEAETSGDQETSLWYLAGATATTADIVVTMSAAGSGAALGAAIAVSGCSASTPTLTATYSSESSDTATYSPTTSVDNTLLLTCTRSSSTAGAWEHGTGQDELADFNNTEGPGDTLTASSELKVSAGGETLTDEHPSGTGIMIGVMMGIEPSVAPAPTRRRLAPWGN